MSPAEHDLADPDCWCGPQVLEICQECEPVEAAGPTVDPHQSPDDFIEAIREAADPDCWRCGGDAFLGEPDPWDMGNVPILVLHDA